MDVIDEGIRTPEKFRSRELKRDFCDRNIRYILKKIDENLKAFSSTFPAPSSIHNKYPAIGNTDWTASFWTGMLWLAYEVTQDGKYRRAAESHIESFTERLENHIGTDTHDLGFLYTLSCVAGYKLSGSERAKEIALKAADLLMKRYCSKAGIIQAWGNLSDPENRGRMIIDCTMNLPLLYWATEVTGKQEYKNAAANHVENAARYIVRPDASTYHTFYMDVETGKPRFGKTQQGYSDDSCWARGQAWGIYGFTLSYLYTGNRNLVTTAEKVANYFLNRLPKDNVCYWDLFFQHGDEERDSSSAAIAACGLLELARHLPLTDPYKTVYESAAVKMAESLAENYLTDAMPDSNGILLHSVYSKPSREGVDECTIWGDYFFFEAMVRLSIDWKPYW